MIDQPAKPWWQSRAVVGGPVAAVASLAGAVGYEVDVGQTTELALELGAMAGADAAIYGRVQAERRIRRQGR